MCGRRDRRWGSNHGTDMQFQGSQGALHFQPSSIQQYGSPSGFNSTRGVQWVREQPCVNKALTCRAVNKWLTAHVCLFASFSILPRCVTPVLNRKLTVCLCNLYTYREREWLLTLSTQGRARDCWPRWYYARTSSVPKHNPQFHSCLWYVVSYRLTWGMVFWDQRTRDDPIFPTLGSYYGKQPLPGRVTVTDAFGRSSLLPFISLEL